MAALFLAMPACHAPAPATETLQVKQSALATPLFVQAASSVPQNPTAFVPVPFGSLVPQTLGNLNVVIIGWNDITSSVTSVMDTMNNTYVRAIAPTRSDSSISQTIYFAKNIRAAIAGGNTVSVQFDAPAAFPDVRILEYSGIDRANPLDVAAGNFGNSTISSSGQLTTTRATDLLVSGNTVQTATPEAGPDFTSRVITSPNGDIAEDRVVTSAGPYTVTTNLSASGEWVMQMAAFRAADITPPTKPTLTATVISPTEIDLSWSTVTDDINVNSFSVERCQGASCSSFSVVGNLTTTTFANTALTPGTSYSYRVRASDGAGNFGDYSSTVTKVTATGCTANNQCGSGFCVSGVCCNNACTDVCGACNLPGHVGTCTPRPSGTTCRVADPNNSCDVAETCNGTSLTCPNDARLPNNSACSDNNACTVNDRCQGGVCVAGTNVSCPSDFCHTAGTCDPATGFCAGVQNVHENSDCDDGNSCTVHAQCKRGVCVPEDPITGCTDGVHYYAPLTNLGSRQGLSAAVDINSNGVVVGNDVHYAALHEFSASGEGVAFRWTASSGVEELPRPPGKEVSSWAISDNGEVVGTAWDPVNVGAWMYHYDPVTQEVSNDHIPGWALGINATGQYTGEALFDGQVYKLFRAQGGGIQQIPIPSGFFSVNGRAIDASGNIVGLLQGWVGSTVDNVAFRYTDALGFEYLEQLLPAGSDWAIDPLVGGDELGAGYGTNGTQIVGSGLTGNGKIRGFVLTPSPTGGPATATIKRIDVPSSFPDDNAHTLIAYRINHDGQVVGTLGDISNGPQRAFIWVDGVGTTDLNTFVDPSSGWVLQSALGINDGVNGNHKPEVVGDGLFNGQKRAFKMTVPDLRPCPGADACHAQVLRDPRSGQCPSSYPVLVDGTSCNDGNECTSNDSCKAGACVGGTLDVVCAVAPIVEGITTLHGQQVGIFSYNNSATKNTNIPYGLQNFLTPPGIDLTGLPPASLPTWFTPGIHRGVFSSPLVNGTVSWTLGARTVTADASSSPTLTPEIRPEGTGVELGCMFPNLSPDPTCTFADLDPDPTPKLNAAVIDSRADYTPAERTADATDPNPIGARAPGTLAGAFNITNDGQARYEIPILVPEGRRGIAPRLSFVYESQRQDTGSLGAGWSVEGLSRISRCRLMPAVAALVNGPPHAVQFDSSDELCLDGERLVSVGIQGQGSLREFRTEREALSRILETGSDDLGATGFDIYRPDGTIESYGGTEGAGRDEEVRQDVAPDGTTSQRNVRLQWYLTKVADRFGNQMSVSYMHSVTATLAGGITLTLPIDPLPLEVRYTANSNLGMAANKSVHFYYVPRDHSSLVTYVAGVRQNRSYLLDHVDITGPMPLDEGLVRRYELLYKQVTVGASIFDGSGRLMAAQTTLTRIRQCDAQGICQEPTQFDWGTSGISFTQTATEIDDAWNPSFNYAGATRFESASRILQAVDIDGDGRDDVLYRRPIPNTTAFDANNPALDPKYLMRLSSGIREFGPAVDPQLPPITVSSWAALSPPTAVPFDFDLDGRIDVAVLQYHGVPDGSLQNSFWQIFRSTGSGYEPVPAGLTIDQFQDPSINPEYLFPTSWGTSMVAADLNGDAYPELFRPLNDPLAQYDQTLGVQYIGLRPNIGGTLHSYQYLPVPTGPGTNRFLFWRNATPQQAHTLAGPAVTAVDVDGDGRTELLVKDLLNPLSDQHAAAPTLLAVNLDGGAASSFPTTLPADGTYTFLDLNGDGLKDAIRTLGAANGPPIFRAAEVWLNTGAAFVKVADVPASSAFQISHGRALDFDGDGREDILYLSCQAPQSVVIPSYIPAYAHPTVYLSSGDGTFKAVDLTDVSAGAVGGPIDAGDATPEVPFTCVATVGDFDGDGRPDILQAAAQPPGSANALLELYTNTGFRGNRITGIHDGLGRQTAVFYGASGAASETCTYPVTCKTPKTQVVVSYETDTGVGSQSSFTSRMHVHKMTYGHAATDVLGRGWLGFGRVTDANLNTGVTRMRTYANDVRMGTSYPYAGIAKSEGVITPLPSGMNRERFRQIVDFQTIVGDPATGVPYAVRPHVIDDNESEVPQDNSPVAIPISHAITTLGYDSFGNLLTREVSRPGLNMSDKMTSTYDQNLDNWLVSLPLTWSLHSVGTNGEVADRSVTFVPNRTTGTIDSQTLEPDDTADQKLTRDFHRNPLDGLLEGVTETDAAGVARSTRVDYDPQDRTFPRTTFNSVGQSHTTLYHPSLGVLVEEKDANNVGVDRVYDGFGRLVGQTGDDGSHMLLNYDQLGGPGTYQISWLRFDGGQGTTTFDVLGREIVVSKLSMDGRPRTMEIGYDRGTGQIASLSRPHRAGEPAETTTSEYDLLGRPTSISPPGEDSTSLSYTSVSILSTTIYQGGIKKQNRILDEMGRVTQTKSWPDASTEAGPWTTFEYGPFSQLRFVRRFGDGQTLATETRYDNRGRTTDVFDPDAGHLQYRYNAFGDLRQEINGAMEQVDWVPDALGRPLTATRGQEIDTFTWDEAEHGLGLLSSSSSSSGVSDIYQYDELARARNHSLSIAGGASYAVGFEYDNLGRLNKTNYPQVAGVPFSVTTDFNVFDGDEETATGTESGQLFWQKIEESPEGLTSNELLADGRSTLRHYDAVTGRLRHISTGSGSVATGNSGFPEFADQIQNLSYAYLGNGNTQSTTDYLANRSETFVYDNLERLTNWNLADGSGVVYDYSELGNLKARHRRPASGATIDEVQSYGEAGAGPGAVTTAPWGTFSYDGAGRQSARPGQPLLTYSRFDLPLSIQTANGQTSFAYDVFGRRAFKGNGTNSTLYLDRFYERRVQSGAISHVLYVYANDRAVAQINCYGPDGSAVCDAPTVLHDDNLGTVETVVDAAGGVSHIQRDPFGRIVSGEKPAGVQRGLLGQEEDGDIGLVNLNHRLYDPLTGRFTTPDPIVGILTSGQAYNRYTYCYNNPLRFVDPSGLQAQPPPSNPPSPPDPVNTLTPEANDVLMAHKSAKKAWGETEWWVYKSGGSHVAGGGNAPPVVQRTDAESPGATRATTGSGSDSGPRGPAFDPSRPMESPAPPATSPQAGNQGGTNGGGAGAAPGPTGPTYQQDYQKWKQACGSSGVERCSDPVDLPLLRMFPHDWIRTPHIEAGIGPGEGVGSGYPGARISVVDQSGRGNEETTTCVEVPCVDAAKVENQLKSMMGKEAGRWTPFNNCWTLCDEVLKNATVGPAPPVPQNYFVPVPAEWQKTWQSRPLLWR